MVGYVLNPQFPDDWDHLTTPCHFDALIEHHTALNVRVSKALRRIHTAEYDSTLETHRVLNGHVTGRPGRLRGDLGLALRLRDRST
jgi:hypothetical protein